MSLVDRNRTHDLLVKDKGTRIGTTVFPLENCTGTTQKFPTQTIEIVPLGSPESQPGPYLPGVYEEYGKDVDPRQPTEYKTLGADNKCVQAVIAKEYSLDLSVYEFYLNPTIVQHIVGAFLAGNNTGTFTLSVKRDEYGE